ncbi:homogentisate 1,2-dioxygenase [Legionella genomosp. 1]|uniref:homogentisate 1,2-dioxygenase n=1 Tax=Legionella genomosp. 1 TaxID=1093625 RepID=UPI001055CFD6|nr:homogentisate 1,2-dioxygenase [Legionella genomosp. 1]
MYLSGFGNHHQTEAIAGALPKNQNSPQECAYGLYAEQLSGSAFTKARAANLHSWLYKTAPSVKQQDYVPYEGAQFNDLLEYQAPNPYRWSPLPSPQNSVDFIDGLFPIAGSNLIRAYIYQCNQSMVHRYFSDFDGELLFVPYEGELSLLTEFGHLKIKPEQIAVIPRGVKFRVELHSASASGYLCENAGSPLTLPPLGVIGANSLANPRHFLYPVAAFESLSREVTLVCKSQQRLWAAQSDTSPLNVVAWHGNLAPYCYDLSLFNTINTVSFDHPDPSIFTVLTSESETAGVANLDFVIFPPRWMVAEHSFRPPYFHRNIMNELMGLIQGEYDAKKSGFLPGGVSIHNCMSGHGPDIESYAQAVSADLKPVRYENTLAFMFETREIWRVSEAAMRHSSRQKDYTDCWKNFPVRSIDR